MHPCILQIFIIHNNRISVLENFDSLKKLKIFNVKNNALERLEESVLYLRRFKRLRSLCIVGNPCCETVESVERYVIAYLPQLVYFEYKLVTAPVQQKHREHYAADIERLEMEEQRISEENSREENDEKHLSDQKMAFIENLNRDQLFELMLDRDPYSHIVVMMKGDLPSIYERYQQEFAVYTQQMFQMGKAEYQKRTQDIDEFTETFENLKTQVNDKNRHIVEEFITKKAFIFYDISQLIREMEQTEDGDERETDEGKEKKMDEKEIEEPNPVDAKEGKDIVEARSKWLKISSKVETKTVEPKANANGEAAPNETGDHDDLDNKDSSFDTNGSKNNFNDKIMALNEIFHDTCNKTYEDLMRNEDVLHEQLMDLMTTLDRVYLDSHVDNFIRQAQLLFTNLRDVQKAYTDIIKEHARKFFNKNIGNPSVPVQLKQILTTADTLSTALDISDRAQLDTIDDREETLLTGVRQWHAGLVESWRAEEVERHRRCVNEICHLIDINREELDDVVNDVALVDPDLLI
ncbi:hypothetical protein M8J76_014545 [Diaphorina citri]|nr:hypothetical protein M8J76_014545 [Diaphorina citri]